jgi:hypothetical protein
MDNAFSKEILLEGMIEVLTTNIINHLFLYHKFCMCLSYHNTCYQFIGYVKITIVDLFVMPLVFAFRTSLQGGFFSRDCI